MPIRERFRTHDARLQEHQDGPLTSEFRARINAVRRSNGLSLQALGHELGFSAVFLQGVLSDSRRQNIRTKHIKDIAEKIDRLEGVRGSESSEPMAGHVAPTADNAPLPLEAIVRAAFAHGFSVEFRPLHYGPAAGSIRNV